MGLTLHLSHVVTTKINRHPVFRGWERLWLVAHVVNREVEGTCRPVSSRNIGGGGHIQLSKAHLPVLLTYICFCKGRLALSQSLISCCFSHRNLTVQQNERWGDTHLSLLAVRMKEKIYSYRHRAQGRLSSVTVICMVPLLPLYFRLHSQKLPLYLSITTSLLAHSLASFI